MIEDAFVDFDIRPLAGTFGAELYSFSLEKTAPRPAALREAFNEYLLLIIRDQALTVGQQIELTEIFGIVDPAWDHNDKHPEEPRVQVISNIGRGDLPYRTTSQYWHTDQSFTARPSKATILHMRELPEQGGDTLFADMRTAFETLPREEQDRLRTVRACHSFGYVMMDLMARRRSEERALKERARFPDVAHPLVRTDPETGRCALYLSELCLSHLVDVSAEESSQILDGLYRHALQEKFIHRHKWRHGDVLIWNNSALMHRATETPSEFRRLLHRTNTEGPVPC